MVLIHLSRAWQTVSVLLNREGSVAKLGGGDTMCIPNGMTSGEIKFGMN